MNDGTEAPQKNSEEMWRMMLILSVDVPPKNSEVCGVNDANTDVPPKNSEVCGVNDANSNTDVPPRNSEVVWRMMIQKPLRRTVKRCGLRMMLIL